MEDTAGCQAIDDVKTLTRTVGQEGEGWSPPSGLSHAPVWA